MCVNTTKPQFICTKAEATQLKNAWKLVAALRKFTARDIAAFCLLTGKPLKPAFSPVRNTKKLAAGQHPKAAWINALTSANFGFDTRRITDKKPLPKEFKTMTDWFKAIEAMPKTQNLDLLKLFSPEIETELAKALGSMHVQDLEIYRETYRAELALAKDPKS